MEGQLHAFGALKAIGFGKGIGVLGCGGVEAVQDVLFWVFAHE